MGILGAILKALTVEELTLNQVVLRLNLNRNSAKACLQELTGRGLVEVRLSKFQTYATSTKGTDWLRDYIRLVRE